MTKKHDYFIEYKENIAIQAYVYSVMNLQLGIPEFSKN